MRIISCAGLLVGLAVIASLAFGQGVNATITGTVTDPSGLVVAGASIEAANVETGALYTAGTTNAGNYAIPGLPVGTYNVTAKVPGFKVYTHTKLAVQAGQVLRENIALEVGSSAESITVQAEASLLKTETGELAHNVTLKELDELPLLVIGGGNGLRNFLSSMVTLPGTYGGNGSTLINGLGQGFVTSEIVKIEGQDASNRLFNNYEYTGMTEPNADAVQEISFQTSNYAPEFGQAGSAVINTTMKSGTNQYHGSGFEYFVNEDLNSGYPFSVSGGLGSNSGGNGGKYRPRSRKNDFGGTLGGPISIPKLYNGKDRTFFYWSYEQYQLTQLFSFNDTVPTAAFRNGDFSAVSTAGNCSLCAAYGVPTGPLGSATYTDALGRPMYANEIYDPLTRGTAANGLGYANPFPNNVIPANRFSATAVAFQKLFPAPSPGNANLTSNLSASVPGGQYSAIPGLKVDQIISPKDKVSFYWSRINAESGVNTGPQAADGLPLSIGAYRGAFIPTTTVRLNYDRTLTPTILLHFGAGFMDTSFSDRAPFLNFDPSQFGLTGFLQHRQTPAITGMCTVAAATVLGGATGCGSIGGMQNIGTSGQLQSQIFEQRPTFNASATWVKGNHTFKFGAELELESVIGGNADFSGVTLAATTFAPVTNAILNAGATAQPFTPTVSFNGFTQGASYANFLLGDFASSTQTPSYLFSREGYQLWGLFAQDSWKVTRKLTVDYGLRWDYATPEHEQHGRLGQLDGTVANANAGGRLGGYRYASTCNCPFYMPAYPYGIGPRIGVAYQVAPKTVLRAGWGFNYQFIANPAGSLVGSSGAYPLAGVNPYVDISTPGSIVQPSWPATNPSIYPIAGTAGIAGQTPFAPDRNENRPPRVNQFSVSIQREITRNLVVEASYVANRAVWLTTTGTTIGTLGRLSQISPAQFAQFGLYPYPGSGPAGYNYQWSPTCAPGNDCDRALLSQPLNSPAVQAKLASAGMPGWTPYAGFPATNSLQSALYPFPQFGNLLITGSPTGNTKYDSLQVKVTKRLSHSLQAGVNFTWGQGFQRATRQDFFNPQSSVWQLQNIPLDALNFNAIYTVPKASFLPKFVNALSSDWQLGWFSSYQSGTYLTPPTSPTLNYLPSQEIRVPGQPLYAPGVNINDHSTFNPYYTQVLNPKAWQPCPVNAVCPSTSVLYKDFRGPRVPSENANIGRHFRIGKGDRKYDFYIRGEFVNIFNRTYFGNPAIANTNPQNPVIHNGFGILTGGFGVINAYLQPNTAYSPGTGIPPARTGTLIARFQF